MNLTDYARSKGISYSTAWRQFVKNQIPNAHRNVNGGIVIGDSLPVKQNPSPIAQKMDFPVSDTMPTAITFDGETVNVSADLKEAKGTKTRRNVSSLIEKTDKYHHIEQGLTPYAYNNKNQIDIREAVRLCQLAYYNFSIYRLTIDTLAEFSITPLYFTGTNKTALKFFEAFFKRINLSDFIFSWFLEYYRSSNVFPYRHDTIVTQEDVRKMTQIMGIKNSNKIQEIKLPIRYTILNPADVQLMSSSCFSNGYYVKVLSDYELEALRNPRTDEDREIFNSLPANVKKDIKTKGKKYVSLPLDSSKILPAFNRKMDYEPFACPLGFPVLASLNTREEIMRVDAAINRCITNMTLLVTMGAPPDEGGVNSAAITAMRKIFENQSVGRVLVSDYTTKMDWHLPQVADILNPVKYQEVNKDIVIGLNNILVGTNEKFANQSMRVQMFVEKLKEGRNKFLNSFLIPEIKRISKILGFKTLIQPHFEDINIKDETVWGRIYAQLGQIGILTPPETMQAIETGRMPTEEESIESQEKYKKLKDKGLYQPLVGGGSAGMQRGRPTGTPSPQTTKKVTPIGQTTKGYKYSLKTIQEVLIDYNRLVAQIQTELKKKHKLKKLTVQQEEVSEELAQLIMSNEDRKKWFKGIKGYIEKPLGTNISRLEELEELKRYHQVDNFVGAILFNSTI